MVRFILTVHREDNIDVTILMTITVLHLPPHPPQNSKFINSCAVIFVRKITTRITCASLFQECEYILRVVVKCIYLFEHIYRYTYKYNQYNTITNNVNIHLKYSNKRSPSTGLKRMTFSGKTKIFHYTKKTKCGVFSKVIKFQYEPLKWLNKNVQTLKLKRTHTIGNRIYFPPI